MWRAASRPFTAASAAAAGALWLRPNTKPSLAEGTGCDPKNTKHISVFLDEKSVQRLKARFPLVDPERLEKIKLEPDSDQQRAALKHVLGAPARVLITGLASGKDCNALVATCEAADTQLECAQTPHINAGETSQLSVDCETPLSLKSCSICALILT
jgi:hypothetical protein